MSTAAPLPLPESDQQELVRRYARKDGQPVALMRCVDAGTNIQVECIVGGAGGPRSAGPYIFQTSGEALRFVDEASLALSYLGCDIS